MRFRHAPAIWDAFPSLVPGVLQVSGVANDVDTAAQVAALTDRARVRVAEASESELAEIQAWRRAFSAMGLSPTKYRCASEALLRRLRTRGSLPEVSPVIDLCNAISAAYAVPVAAIDRTRIDGDLTVRHAVGDERYESFGGDVETPEVGEVIFADDAGYAHARRWTNRQSARSAYRPQTTELLLVCEAMHPGANDDVARLLDELADAFTALGATPINRAVLTPAEPAFQAATRDGD